MGKNKKTISVLLTRNYDCFSQMIYNIIGHGYTHASLGFAEDNNSFYSFNSHGFCEETIEKHRRHGVKVSCCYQLEVTDEVYEVLRQSIHNFRKYKKQYHYAHIGVVFCLLHIPFREKNGYFCSQFVAELLTQSGILESKRKSSLYLPNQFQWDLQKLPSLCDVSYCVV